MKKTQITNPLNDAERVLVESHICVAVKISKKYAGLGRLHGIPREDLQQEACIGLCMAAQRYDPSNASNNFSSYASDWCKKCVMACIEGTPLREDTDGEPAEEVLTDEEETMGQERALRVAEMLELLDPRERKVVRMLYGFDSNPMSFGEVARQMRLRPARVHQIYDSAMVKMLCSTY